ncbi:MAG: rod-binding protein [Rhodobacteraceae bacterium]|nr:rod-binding protein [Paracoccaceae bacterium]
MTVTQVAASMPTTRSPQSDDALRQVAVDLEATFLAEMLKSAGLGEARSEMGGGVGEEQFSSFLRSEQAKLMAQQGGVGLAENIFEALKRRALDGQ